MTTGRICEDPARYLRHRDKEFYLSTDYTVFLRNIGIKGNKTYEQTYISFFTTEINGNKAENTEIYI